MIEIQKASVEFGGEITPEDAEEIVTRALRLAARRLPDRDGAVWSLSLPDVEIAPGMDALAASDALADAVVLGVANAREGRNA